MPRWSSLAWHTADFIAQHMAPTPLPLGVITVMIGGGYLGWLLFTEARRHI